MPRKILVVDDEPDVITYLTTLLRDNGFETITATNGKEAFDKALSEAPDLICLDISMPDESGVKCYRNLCENEKTKNIPVFIVTGISRDFKHFIETRRQVPAPKGYFEKPIDRIEFISKIKETLGN
jgi:CheY-like chemotaxis protein